MLIRARERSALAVGMHRACNVHVRVCAVARDASKLSSAVAAVRACASHVDFECVAVSADVTNDAVIAAAFTDEPLLRDADLLLCCAGVDCAKKVRPAAGARGHERSHLGVVRRRRRASLHQSLAYHARSSARALAV